MGSFCLVRYAVVLPVPCDRVTVCACLLYPYPGYVIVADIIKMLRNLSLYLHAQAQTLSTNQRQLVHYSSPHASEVYEVQISVVSRGSNSSMSVTIASSSSSRTSIPALGREQVTLTAGFFIGM